MEAADELIKTEELTVAFRQMKEAELNLEEVLFQAQNKLTRCRKAHSVDLNDLVKYSHYISVDHSVAAPLNWEQGDPRR